MLKGAGEVKDPVHGYIYFTEEERVIMDSAPVQRLRRIKQLAGSDLTYPGAIHNRFIHSLGTMHLSGILAERLRDLGYIDLDGVKKLRISGLLHDVGHGPFSHVYEEVLNERRGLTHEDLTSWIVKEGELKEVLGDLGYSKDEVADLSVGRLKGADAFLNQVVTGRLSPDTMDYIVRDSYFTGVGFGAVDIRRLIDSLDVVDGSVAVEYPGALYVLEAFIIARLELFNAVYFHRTVRAANIMLSRAILHADEELKLTGFTSIDEFLSMDDCSLVSSILSLKDAGEAGVAKQLISMLNRRRMFKSVYEIVIHREEGLPSTILKRPSLRKKLEEEVGEAAGVDPDYIVIDVPTVLSVPVHPKDGTEVLVFKRGVPVEVRKVTEVSRILSSLSKFTDVVRVYTLQEHKEAVEKACRKFFAESSLTSTSV